MLIEILYILISFVIIIKLLYHLYNKNYNLKNELTKKKYLYYLIGIFNFIILLLFIILPLSNNFTFEQFGGSNLSNNIKNKLKRQCGLPNKSYTSHCFNDLTHHTCCKLGPKARKYADNSGNPIGEISEKASYDFNGKIDNLTPWCTCLGSEVCSYYADKFNDGTHVEFISNPKTGKNVKNLSEKEFKKIYNVLPHKTPGVNK